MQIIFFVFIALVAIAANFMFSGSNNATSTPTTATNSKNSQLSKNTNYSAPQESPDFFIDTYITLAPEDGEIITQTNKVTFKFWGVTTQAIKGDLSYETKIIGLDSKWQSNTSGERTVDFPSGSKEYTFMVRTKADGFYDSTPASVTFTVKTSPYFGKLKINSISSDSIILGENLSKEESITVTGWKIKGRGGEFVIPAGIEIYPGYYTPTNNISIKDGDNIYIKSAYGPFGANNAFKPNKCFGYLNNTGFSYSKICPEIKNADICNFSQNCQNAISQLRGCNRVDSSSLSSLTYDFDCQMFINNYTNLNLNYGGCVSNYSKNSDFFSDWYIYAGFSIACKSSCGNDTVYLYDANGLLVDKKDYNY